MGAFPDGGSWQREAGVLSLGQLWGRPPLPLLSDAVETVFLSQAAHCTHTGDWGSPHGAEAAGSPLGRLLPSLPTSLLTLPGSQCVQVGGGQGPVAGDRGPLCVLWATRTRMPAGMPRSRLCRTGPGQKHSTHHSRTMCPGVERAQQRTVELQQRHIVLSSTAFFLKL